MNFLRPSEDVDTKAHVDSCQHVLRANEPIQARPVQRDGVTYFNCYCSTCIQDTESFVVWQSKGSGRGPRLRVKCATCLKWIKYVKATRIYRFAAVNEKPRRNSGELLLP